MINCLLHLICFIHKISVSNTNYAFYTQSMCFYKNNVRILEQLERLKCAGCILYAVPLNFPLFFVYFFISVENDKVSVATYRLAAQLKPLLAKTAKLVKTQFEFRMDIIYHLILSDMQQLLPWTLPPYHFIYKSLFDKFISQNNVLTFSRKG